MGCSWAGFVRGVKTTLAHIFSNVGLVAMVIGYTVAGAFLFRWLEIDNPVESFQREHALNCCLTDILNITDRLSNANVEAAVLSRLFEFESSLVSAVRSGKYEADKIQKESWSFISAMFYCVTVITTIGYGNVAPASWKGKMATIGYALFGIPIFLLCLSNIGDLMASTFRFTYRRLCCTCCFKKREDDKYLRVTRPSIASNSIPDPGGGRKGGGPRGRHGEGSSSGSTTTTTTGKSQQQQQQQTGVKRVKPYKPKRNRIVISSPINVTINRGSDHPFSETINDLSTKRSGSSQSRRITTDYGLSHILEECQEYTSGVKTISKPTGQQPQSVTGDYVGIETLTNKSNPPNPLKPPITPSVIENGVQVVDTPQGTPILGSRFGSSSGASPLESSSKGSHLGMLKLGSTSSLASRGGEAWSDASGFLTPEIVTSEFQHDPGGYAYSSSPHSPTQGSHFGYDDMHLAAPPVAQQPPHSPGKTMVVYNAMSGESLVQAARRQGSRYGGGATLYTDPVTGMPIDTDVMGFKFNPIRKNSSDADVRVPVIIVLLFMVSYLMLGALLFKWLEDWTLMDAAYFCFITLSTIGFGDFVPGKSLGYEDLSAKLKLVAGSVYLLLGLAVLAMSFSLVQEEVILKCKSFALTIGLIKE